MLETNIKEMVILVDAFDNQIGTAEKMYAHEQGMLHRAFSIFVFNKNNELLIQQRALDKYHSAGLWTNTCCSHPRPGESLMDAAHRRLREEMGFDCPLVEKFSFTYKAKVENGLTEHEIDHVFVGFYDQDPIANPQEVHAWKYVSLQSIEHDLITIPQHYSTWFRLCFNQVKGTVFPQ